MNRIQLACFGLVASAFVLAGLLIVQLGDRHGTGFSSPAYGGQVIARDNFTLLTATTRENEDSLFILDGSTGRLVIYRFNPGRNRVELAGSADLNQVFGQAAVGDDNGRRPGPRR